MTLNEKTTIPIGIAIALIGGGAAWLSTIASQSFANAKSLEVIEQRHYQYLQSIQKIEKDVAVIKTQLELLDRSKERK